MDKKTDMRIRIYTHSGAALELVAYNDEFKIIWPDGNIEPLNNLKIEKINSFQILDGKKEADFYAEE